MDCVQACLVQFVDNLFDGRNPEANSGWLKHICHNCWFHSLHTCTNYYVVISSWKYSRYSEILDMLIYIFPRKVRTFQCSNTVLTWLLMFLCSGLWHYYWDTKEISQSIVTWLNVQCSLVLVGQMAACVYVAAILFFRMSNRVYICQTLCTS